MTQQFESEVIHPRLLQRQTRQDELIRKGAICRTTPHEVDERRRAIAMKRLDIPPELPKPVEPPPKSEFPVVLLFVAPKPVVFVAPKPVWSEEDSSK